MKIEYKTEVKNLEITAKVNFIVVDAGVGITEFFGYIENDVKEGVEIISITPVSLYYNGTKTEIRPLFKQIIQNYLYQKLEDIELFISENI